MQIDFYIYEDNPLWPSWFYLRLTDEEYKEYGFRRWVEFHWFRLSVEIGI